MNRIISGTLTERQEKGLSWRRGVQTDPVIDPATRDEDALFALVAAACDVFASSADSDDVHRLATAFRNSDDAKRAAILQLATGIADPPKGA